MFGATVSCASPAPLPLAPAVMVIHAGPPTEDHVQPALVSTRIGFVPPGAPTLRLAGLTENLQPGDCVTVTVRPAIVSVPVLVGPSVGATRTPTTPGPLPLFPLVTMSHAARLSAVQAQPGGAVTTT